MREISNFSSDKRVRAAQFVPPSAGLDGCPEPVEGRDETRSFARLDHKPRYCLSLRLSGQIVAGLEDTRAEPPRKSTENFRWHRKKSSGIWFDDRGQYICAERTSKALIGLPWQNRQIADERAFTRRSETLRPVPGWPLHHDVRRASAMVVVAVFKSSAGLWFSPGGGGERPLAREALFSFFQTFSAATGRDFIHGRPVLADQIFLQVRQAPSGRGINRRVAICDWRAARSVISLGTIDPADQRPVSGSLRFSTLWMRRL